MTVYEAALKYIENGWHVIPLKYANKAPIVKDWPNVASTDPEQIRKWFDGKPLNIGIAAGQKSGFWVLDIDGEEGKKQLQELIDKHKESLPNTLRQTTGSGGLHIFFKYDSRIEGNKVRKFRGIDVRADGGQVVVYPSIHPSGNQYKWIEDAKEILPAPEWLIEEITKDEVIVKTEHLKLEKQIGQGERNDALYRIACKYRNNGLEEHELRSLIHAVNEVRCNPPLSVKEVDIVVDSALKYEPTKTLIEQPKENTDISKLLKRIQERGLEYFQQSYNRSGLLGYKLGPQFKELEYQMDGIQSGMYLLGAVANVGKTTWLLNLSKSLIEENEGLQVVFFSIDDHFKKIYYRLLALESNRSINQMANIGQRVRLNKDLKPDEIDKELKKANETKDKVSELLSNLILLDESDGNSLVFISQVIREMYKINPKLVVIVDNFHKIRNHGPMISPRERFTKLSEEMKALSNRFDIPIIMTVELRKLNHNGPPGPDDLKETVDLHYDCDVAFFLHSESERQSDSNKIIEIDYKTYPIVDLLVSKNKLSSFKGTIEYLLQPEMALYQEIKYFKEDITEGFQATIDPDCPF